ncbi:MAG: hypothetical protein ACOY4P_16820 [Pseudomonadota bacterium]
MRMTTITITTTITMVTTTIILIITAMITIIAMITTTRMGTGTIIITITIMGSIPMAAVEGGRSHSNRRFSPRMTASRRSTALGWLVGAC